MASELHFAFQKQYVLHNGIRFMLYRGERDFPSWVVFNVGDGSISIDCQPKEHGLLDRLNKLLEKFTQNQQEILGLWSAHIGNIPESRSLSSLEYALRTQPPPDQDPLSQDEDAENCLQLFRRALNVSIPAQQEEEKAWLSWLKS